MRVALGQLWQETNTLNPVATTQGDFEQFGVLRGAEMLRQLAKTNEIGGFLQSLRTWNSPPEPVGLVRLPAWPSGLATAATFAWLRDTLLESLDQAWASGPLDAVLLALHGALAADQHPDVEGEILTAVRKRVGPRVPIVATLDLHANVTPAMVAAADVLVPYHTMPHIDIFETGLRAGNVLRRILVEGEVPVMAFQKIPAVVPAERSNTEAAEGIAADLKARIQQWERDPRILAAGILPVQPWLDIPEFGSSVLVTAAGDRALAAAVCSELAACFWNRRRDYLPELVSAADAARLAFAEHGEGLVVLSDPADATTSGAPGDSVWILKELLPYAWTRPVLVTVVSPELVAAAEQAGPGQTLQATLGGVRDTRFGTRLPFAGIVERLFDARFVMSGHIGKDLTIDMGRSAVLQAGPVRVILTSRSGPHFAPELFQTAGFDPFQAAVVVAKSPCGFRAVYAGKSRAIYSVRAPGCAPTDFWNYPYRNIPRPLWPWDEIESWSPQPVLREPEAPFTTAGR